MTGDLWSRLAARHGLPRQVVKQACHMYLYMANLTFEEAVARCEARCQGLKLAEMLRDFEKRAETQWASGRVAYAGPNLSQIRRENGPER